MANIKAAERSRAWRLAHPEKAKKYQHDWYQKNKEKLKRKSKKYNKEHAQEIKSRRLQERKNDPAKYMLRVKRNECIKFDVEFSLKLSDIEPLPVTCPVLDLQLNYTVLTGRPEDNSPSIDRFNNTLGYVHGNVRVISNRANRLKGDGTLEEHLKIAEYMKGTNA
jgi:hypothetical protein